MNRLSALILAGVVAVATAAGCSTEEPEPTPTPGPADTTTAAPTPIPPSVLSSVPDLACPTFAQAFRAQDDRVVVDGRTAEQWASLVLTALLRHDGYQRTDQLRELTFASQISGACGGQPSSRSARDAALAIYQQQPDLYRPA